MQALQDSGPLRLRALDLSSRLREAKRPVLAHTVTAPHLRPSATDTTVISPPGQQRSASVCLGLSVSTQLPCAGLAQHGAGTDHPRPCTPASVPAPNCCPFGVLCRPSECTPRQTSVSRCPVPFPHACSGWVGCACSPSCFVRPADCDSQLLGAAAAPATRLKCRKSRACAGPGPGQGRCQRRSTLEAPRYLEKQKMVLKTT